MASRPLRSHKNQPKDAQVNASGTFSDSVQSIMKKDVAKRGKTAAHSYMEKVQALKRLLDDQLLVCDAKFSMFFTAALTHDYESNLEPHPPRYSGEKSGIRIDELIAALQKVPPLKLLRQMIDNKHFGALDAPLDTELVELLYWLLVSVPQPPMRLLDNAQFITVVGKLSPNGKFPQPTQVFALGNMPKPAVRTIQTAGLATKYVFAATKFGHVHVITHIGFKPHLLISKHLDAVFVFWELRDAIEHGRATAGWGVSECGSVINCVVLCELAIDAKFVEPSGLGALVKQGELLTPRYLLFYAKPRETLRPPMPVNMKRRRYNHLFSVVSFIFIMGMMYLKEYYTTKEIWDGFIFRVQRLFRWTSK